MESSWKKFKSVCVEGREREGKDGVRGYLFPFQLRGSLLKVLVYFFALFLVFVLDLYFTDNPIEGKKGKCLTPIPS